MTERQIIVVLHAHDLRDRSPINELTIGNVAQPNVLDETLSLEIGQNSERLRERSIGQTGVVNTKIDNVQNIEAKMAKIIVNCADDFLF